MANKPIEWRTEKRKLQELKSMEGNPRQATEKQVKDLTRSLEQFNLAAPLIINTDNTIIEGHFRFKILKDNGHKEIDVRIPNRKLTQEEVRELNLRLNKNLGEWDIDLLANFGEDSLSDIGFSSEELDNIFDLDVDEPEMFDLEKELKRLGISGIKVKKGDIYQLGKHRLMCGDAANPGDLNRLSGGDKMDFCFTDPPYMLDYLHTKWKGKGSSFGYKANRRYLQTDVAITFDKWIPNIAEMLADDASIIIFEYWKNLIPLWEEVKKHFRIRNLIIWHLTNRTQGFAAKYRLFSKYDIAMLATKGDQILNLEDEDELLQNEYEAAIFATIGKPHWEPYRRERKYCPTDVITSCAGNLATSGQGIIFGTKPIKILIPYIKVLTRRDMNVIDPFGGSGSTLMACEKLKRQCYTMELVPTYCEVIKIRWERLTGKMARKIE